MDEMEEDLYTLFERYKDSGTEEEKAGLAERYLDLFSELCYDFSSGKLKGDLEFLLEIVENIEVLQGNTSWSLRAQVYEILMEDAEEQKNETAIVENGLRSIEASLKLLEEGGEFTRIAYERISFCYYTLISYAPDEAIDYWEKSLNFVKEAILENPGNGNWTHYFKLLYTPLENAAGLLAVVQKREREAFREWAFSLEIERPLGYVIASAFVRFREHMEYMTPAGFVFPETEYSFWLEKSLSEDVADDAYTGFSGIGHFYRKEGVRLGRIDLLEQALLYYKKMWYETSDGFAIYYSTDAWEQMAILYQKNNAPSQADTCMLEALEWNEDKQDTTTNNFSLLLHYAEFLERCYHYQGAIPKPSLSFIRAMAKQAEAMGEGYYSGPYFLQARIALEQNKEKIALAHLSSALLLHELCIESSVAQFYLDLPKGKFPYLEKFVSATLLFMKEVSVGYYFSPVIKIAELNLMTDDMVIEAWILRKAEIRKRSRPSAAKD